MCNLVKPFLCAGESVLDDNEEELHTFQLSNIRNLFDE